MRYNKKEMKIRLDYNNMMSTAVADGFTDKDFSSRLAEITNCHDQL